MYWKKLYLFSWFTFKTDLWITVTCQNIGLSTRKKWNPEKDGKLHLKCCNKNNKSENMRANNSWVISEKAIHITYYKYLEYNLSVIEIYDNVLEIHNEKCNANG